MQRTQIVIGKRGVAQKYLPEYRMPTRNIQVIYGICVYGILTTINMVTEKLCG